MSLSRSAVPFRVMASLTLAWIALPVVQRAGGRTPETTERFAIQRGSVEREGRAWVERSEFTAPAKEGGRLVVRADFGQVVVRTGAADKVQCQVSLRAYTASAARAKRYFMGYDLNARRLEGGGVYIGGRGAGDNMASGSFEAEFQVTVPKRFNLDLETHAGNIAVETALEGDVRATTAGGDIRAGDVSGPFRAETAGGSITLGNIGGRVEGRTAGGNIRTGRIDGDAALETSGGEIAVGHVAGGVRAETAGGDVIVEGAGGSVLAQTAGGQIRIGPAGSNVRAETAGGSVWLQGGRGTVDVDTAGGSINLFQVQGAIRATTAAGPILAQIAAEGKHLGPSELETAMGDIEVFLPPELALTIDAAIEMAAGHKILSDFPLVIEGDDEEDAEREIRGRGALNGGGSLLRIRTVNGNIEIRKLNAQTLARLKERQRVEWQRKEKHRTKEGRQGEKPGPPDSGEDDE